MRVCITALLAVAAPVHSSLPTPSPFALLEPSPAPVEQDVNVTLAVLPDAFSRLLLGPSLSPISPACKYLSPHDPCLCLPLVVPLMLSLFVFSCHAASEPFMWF